MKRDDKISRRDFLKLASAGSVAVAASVTGCSTESASTAEKELGAMTMRTTPTSGDHVSLLGYGCMRWPTKKSESARDSKDEIDQEQVNRLVDEAMAHGVNYFDTAPVYCQGLSERATGIALSRHPRDKYFVATKLSNMNPALWEREKSIEMYRNSFKELQVDYIDYLLLHSVGGNTRELNSMELFETRFINNGVLDFLLEERKAGRIRNLGFSFHGDVRIFDYLLSRHDEYKWDFVQIQLNYVDWFHAKATNKRNVDASYLYAELEKRGIPAVIMEPLLGGRLSRVPGGVARKLKMRDPERSVASWAFRFAGTPKGVLTVLSGMTYMEHLQDNLQTYCPLVPLTEEDQQFLFQIADEMVTYKTIPCNDCKYCMPCPYGLDIPSILVHYNKCVNEGLRSADINDESYRQARREFLIGYDRSVPRLRQADHCVGCSRCVPHCPQRIDIPREMEKINDYIEELKRREFQ